MSATDDTRARRAEVRSAAERVVRLLNEVEAGVRPAQQVTPMFAAHLRGALRRLRPAPGPVADLHRLVICSTVDGAYEIVAICRRHGRFVAMGLRLARSGPAWTVTDVAHARLAVGGRPHMSDVPGPPGSPPASAR